MSSEAGPREQAASLNAEAGMKRYKAAEAQHRAERMGNWCGKNPGGLSEVQKLRIEREELAVDKLRAEAASLDAAAGRKQHEAEYVENSLLARCENPETLRAEIAELEAKHPGLDDTNVSCFFTSGPNRLDGVGDPPNHLLDDNMRAFLLYRELENLPGG